MFFQWIELRLLNPAYIWSYITLRCFYILWLNLPLMPLLTHHETRDECRGFLIFILSPMCVFCWVFLFAFVFPSATFTIGTALPFSSPTHFSSQGFSAAHITISLTPIRPGNSSPASVHTVQLQLHRGKEWAFARPLYFFSCVWDTIRTTSPLEGWSAIVYHLQMCDRISGGFL